jgi:hypothetical protein
MTCLVTLNLGAGDCDRGFPSVTAQLWRAETGEQMQFTGALPAAPDLVDAYQQWQHLYIALQTGLNIRRWDALDSGAARGGGIEVDPTGATNIAAPDLDRQGQHLARLLNQWLSSPTFRPIDQQLRTHLHPRDAIQVIVQTADPWLRRVPWHLWDFFAAYPAAEPALGALQYQGAKPVHRSRQYLRILAVLGHSHGIDVAHDQALLDQLSAAEVVFLVEPSRAELDHWLWQGSGWDILFFAGHSATADHTQGYLAINPQRHVSLTELHHALDHAIGHGLTLAIFNSCDGLGLAQGLMDLNIPQLVVMREPVPDPVAQAFLKDWLQRLAEGIPLAQALRQARQRLQGLEDDFPGASWLPVLVQNPATPPLQWPQPAPMPASISAPDLADSRSRQQYHNRQALLNRVQQDWIEGLLDKSLHGQALISLGLEEQPQALVSPWNLSFDADPENSHPLPEGTDIVQVYDRLGAGCTLLLLGEPGAGKTTTLLTLARTLVRRAQADVNPLIPVVLNLSTWASHRDAFLPWLIWELKTKYRVPSKISRQWIEEQALLLLLDGLDEVAPTYRDSCIQALNRFSQETGIDLVVCCRAKDYAEGRHRLAFQTALYLRSLSVDQVRVALAAGEPLQALAQIIETQPIWQELAQSPLMLDIMMLTYQGVEFGDLPQADDLDAHRQRLFAAYLKRMFQRRRTELLYPPRQVVRQLAWLAQHMQRHSQSVFLLEALQPSWLDPARDRLRYELAIRAVLWLLWGGLHVGLIAGHGFDKATFDWGDFAHWGRWGLLGGMVYSGLAGFSQHYLPYPWSWGVNSVTAAVVFGWLFSQVGESIAMADAMATSAQITQVTGMSLAWGLAYGVIYAGISGLVDWQLATPIRPKQALRWSARKGMFAGGLGLVVALALALGPGVGVLQSLVFGTMVAIAGGFDKRRSVDKTTTFPNQGIIQALKNAALLFGMIGLATAILMSFLEPWVSGVVNGLLFGVAAAILVAGITATKHYVLRAMLALQGRAPWRYRRFLDYGVQLILLRRVGGGYVFIHRLLLEYLATHSADANAFNP